MNLYTDAFNLNAFKIIAVAEYCGENVEIEKHKTGAAGKNVTKYHHQSPIFETPNKYEYFSSNAACRYLYLKNRRDILPETECWLEWESTEFQPQSIACLSKGATLSEEFKQYLRYLDSVLISNEFLSCRKEYGLEDIVIWCDIFPYMDIFSADSVSQFSKITKWYNKLKLETTLQEAVGRIFGNTEKKCLQKLLSFSTALSPQSSKFTMPVNVPNFSFESPTKSSSSKQEDDAEEGTKVFTDEEIAAAYESWLKGIDGLPPVRPVASVILPKEGEPNILITSALPYVNNVPHLGNIIGAVLSADVFARYCRLRGYNTLYICGTDEYGTATETKAIELGVTPREICDRFNKLHSEIYKWFNISFDYFGRTTTEQQTKIAQDIFLKLHKRDYLIEDSVEQLFCNQCKRFLADRFVEGTCPFCSYEDARGDQCDKCGKLINAPELKQPMCKVCKATPTMKTSTHLFLDLPKLEPQLKVHLDKVTKSGHWSNTAKVITYSWLKEGLKPRCITRDLKWGTPVPLKGFSDKVFYVWYDAPIGYLSITANYTKDWELWWKQPNLVQLYQFMAKDNVPFHAIIFPACQLGTEDDYTVVDHLVATEYLNYEDVKFSKSRGIGVFGDDAKNTGIPSDIWRFYLLYLRPENQDTAFNWNDMMLKNNSELLNNLGNFINRALMFVTNNFGGVIPNIEIGEDEKYLLAQVMQELSTYIQCMQKTKLRDAIKPILNISRTGNQYIQSHKPWEKIKGSDLDRCTAGSVLGLSVNIACLLCTLMEPYMPETCKNLRLQLNTTDKHHVLGTEFVCLLPPGHQLGKPAPLFKKIDQETINELKSKYGGKQTPERAEAKKEEVKIENNVNQTELEKLDALVANQGNKVRQLKTEKAEKSVIDQEVATLLNLKKQLALLKGETPEPAKKKKSKSKK